MTQPDRVPTDADAASLPTPRQVASVKPIKVRAREVGRCAATLHSYVESLQRRRAAAAVVLHRTYGWAPFDIYRPLGVVRRTYTNWVQRTDELNRAIPDMTEADAKAELHSTNEGLQRWEPIRDEFLAMRTALYRQLMEQGVSESATRAQLGMTRDQSRSARAAAFAAGVQPPPRRPISTEVATYIADQIAAGAAPFVDKLPGEIPLAQELTALWGRKVGRSVVSRAYQALARSGVVHSVPKTGWYVGAAGNDEKSSAARVACG